MKKAFSYLVPTLLVLVLAACGGNASESNTTAGSAGANNPELEIPIETKLMLGSVKLEESAYPIDSGQAAKLLPLWKALRSLASSETTAQAELEAVIESITDTMTAEQLAAIDAMDLSMQDFADVAETLGLEGGLGGRWGEMTPEMQATLEAAQESGDWPPEGFGGFEGGQGQGGGFMVGPGPGGGFEGGQGPGGGFGGGAGGGAGLSPEMRETAIAARGDTLPRGFGINTQLLEALITFLEAK